ncbi:hypothetical protein [Glaciecola sp. SC05]|uniref:hypothetical protein n=1 Tax=Glaciecola sp. SC05 TaxID=1987355 RepID=UPI0035288B9C
MKTLFFIISAVGLVYLMVSSMDLESFSFSPEQTVTSVNAIKEDQADLATQDIRKVIEDVKALSDAQLVLQQEMSTVNTLNSELKEAFALLDKKLSGSNQVKQGASVNNNRLTTSSPLNEPAAMLEAAPALNAAINSSATTVDTEQQKRLRQQAVLRDLAQKRQIAAIGALQTGSSY